MLVPVTINDAAFLYNMLKERTPEMSISFQMPTFEYHCKFLVDCPYEAWYIIFEKGERLGNIYLTKKDEVGYFIKKEYQGQGYCRKAFKELTKKHPRKHYYANVNPRNKNGIRFVEKLGGKLVQLTYKITNKNT